MSDLGRLIRAVAGEPAAADILDTLQIDRALLAERSRELTGPAGVCRAVFAMALNALLFQDLLDRVPSGAAYVAAGVYPLDRLQMTGHAFAHREFSASMPQFFISELHVERMATEGCAFNHATDRVADVDAVACEQRALGRPIKDNVEVSRSGSVRQTAFKADPVARTFGTDNGETTMMVPGSFYEFISRDVIANADGTRQLDLRFDSMNAEGIFKMTAAA